MSDRLERIKRLRKIKQMRAAKAAPEGDMPQAQAAPEASPTTPTEQIPSGGEALLAGAQEGLTLGWADEIGGAMESGMDWLAEKELMPGVDYSPTQVAQELEDQGIRGDVGPTSRGEMYDASIAADEARRQELKQARPGMYMAGEIGGGIIAPGLGVGKIAKMGKSVGGKIATGAAGGALAGGVAGAGAAEQGEKIGGAVSGAAMGSAFGGLVGGVSGKLGQMLDKTKKLEKQKKELANFMDITAKKRGSQGYQDDLTVAHDELLDALKGQKKITREELRDALIKRKGEIGDEIGNIRSKEVSLSRKDLERTLKQKLEESDALMSGQAKQDYKKALKNLYPDVHKQLNKEYDSIAKKIADQEDKLARKQAIIADLKAKGQNVTADQQSAGRMEKRLNDLSTYGDSLLGKIDDIETGDLTLEQVYNMKKFLKRPGFQGEGEKYFRELEHKLGKEMSEEYAPAMKKYGSVKEFIDPAESSVGKFEKAQDKGPLPSYLPLGMVNKALKTVQALTPKHKEALKIAGFKPSSALMNSKYRQVIVDALESGGPEALASRLFILQRRDAKFRELMNKQAEDEQEE